MKRLPGGDCHHRISKAERLTKSLFIAVQSPTGIPVKHMDIRQNDELIFKSTEAKKKKTPYSNRLTLILIEIVETKDSTDNPDSINKTGWS